jgi:hypothetical protein
MLNPRLRIERDWEGMTAVIIGGGPSLSLAQIREVAIARGKPDSLVRVIAVNDAVYVAWFADWLHACDGKWWRWNIQSVYRFPGRKTTLDPTIPAQWVDGHLEFSEGHGYDPDPSKCRGGSNSGYQALHLAAHAGVKRAILIGFDMQAPNDGAPHWFGQHEKGREFSQAAPKIWRKRFPPLAEDLARIGVEVLNASIETAVDCFPRVDLKEALVGSS